jgi:hypothetical protein
MRRACQINRLVLLVTLIGCSGAMAQEVLANFLLGTDFSKYHTYRWISIEGTTHPSQSVDARIRQSFDTQLASKGFSRSDSDKADLYVGYQAAVDQKRDWKRYGDGGSWGEMPAVASPTLDVGTLVLDMYDPTVKLLVWTGAATKTLDPNGNEEENMKNTGRAAHKMLRNYPPK